MHAHSQNYVTDEEFTELLRLCRRAIGAATGLRLYLLSLPKNFDPRKLNPKPGTHNHEPKPSEPETREPLEP